MTDFAKLADLYKMFGDETRLRILFELEKGELCVCSIAENLGMSQSAVSHQLNKLRMTHLVKSRKDGKHVLYTFDDEHVKGIFDLGIDHMNHN